MAPTFPRKPAPKCSGKYVYLDQGGELYRNPKVVALFKRFGYTVRPTGADSSNQNGPVERAHLTVANAIRALLLGASLPAKFWPYAFHHWLRITRSLPSRDQDVAPYTVTTGKTDDLSKLRTFGCRVWVRPPGRRRAKLVPNSRKGLFLGLLPNTDKNIIWYDVETGRVKVAKHARFDEGMNDLPVDGIPPNVIHLQRTQDGAPLPAEPHESSIDAFEFSANPFAHTLTRHMKVRCKSPTFGLVIHTDEVNNRAFVKDIKKGSSASQLFSTHKSTCNKICGAYIIGVNDHPVFTKEDVISAL